MKELISSETLAMIQNMDKKIMLVNNKIIAIHSFEYVKEKKVTLSSWLFKRKIDKELIYLTKLEIFAYNSKCKFIGALNDDDALHIIRWYNLYYYRSNWESLKEELNAFGFEIKKKEIETKEKEIETK